MPIPIIGGNSEPLEAKDGSESPEHQNRQRRRMTIALALLLVTLAILLVKDRDFWFPSSATADLTDEDRSPPALPPVTHPQPAAPEVKPPAAVVKTNKHATLAAKVSVPESGMTPVVTNRAALPPLQVE